MLSETALEAIAEELQASESRFRKVFDSTLIGMAVVTLQGDVLEANALYARLVGFSQAELVGMNFQRFTDPDDVAEELQLFKELLAGERRSFWLEKRYLTKHHVPRWVELWVTALPNASGQLDKAIGMIVDITEQKKTNMAMQDLRRDLNVSHQLLRDMGAQNDAIRESERAHVAHEVHDELGQVMTALRLKLSVIELRHGPGIPELADEMQEMKKLVDQAIHGVRNVVGSLRPTALDLGLVPAIEWLRTEFALRTAIDCEFDWGNESFELDDKRAVVVFRIVQESLTNVSRHAQASRVDIRLKYEGDGLQLEVRDNGVGFNPEAVRAKRSFGLLGMKERALALGGHLEISSRQGGGSVISLTISNTVDAAGAYP